MAYNTTSLEVWVKSLKFVVFLKYCNWCKRKAYEEINNSLFKALKIWLYWIKYEAADWRLRGKQSAEQLLTKWAPLSCIYNEAAHVQKLVSCRWRLWRDVYTGSHSFSIGYFVWRFLTFDACFCKINTLLMKALVTNHAQWLSFGSLVADVLQAFHDTVQKESYYEEGECKLPPSILHGFLTHFLPHICNYPCSAMQ